MIVLAKGGLWRMPVFEMIHFEADVGGLDYSDCERVMFYLILEVEVMVLSCL